MTISAAIWLRTNCCYSNHQKESTGLYGIEVSVRFVNEELVKVVGNVGAMSLRKQVIEDLNGLICDGLSGCCEN